MAVVCVAALQPASSLDAGRSGAGKPPPVCRVDSDRKDLKVDHACGVRGCQSRSDVHAGSRRRRCRRDLPSVAIAGRSACTVDRADNGDESKMRANVAGLRFVIPIGRGYRVHRVQNRFSAARGPIIRGVAPASRARQRQDRIADLFRRFGMPSSDPSEVTKRLLRVAETSGAKKVEGRWKRSRYWLNVDAGRRRDDGVDQRVV